MIFRNPWIDPRIGRLRPDQVERYLLHNGWTLTGPAMNPRLIRYDVADGNENAPTLFLPLRVDDGPGLQWLIELVGELALWQGRYAGDVLTDILAQAEDGAADGTGPQQTREPKTATR
jgi:hypothetical protein